MPTTLVASISTPEGHQQLDTRDWKKWKLEHPYITHPREKHTTTWAKGTGEHVSASAYDAKLKSDFSAHLNQHGSQTMADHDLNDTHTAGYIHDAKLTHALALESKRSTDELTATAHHHFEAAQDAEADGLHATAAGHLGTAHGLLTAVSDRQERPKVMPSSSVPGERIHVESPDLDTFERNKSRGYTEGKSALASGASTAHIRVTVQQHQHMAKMNTDRMPTVTGSHQEGISQNMARHNGYAAGLQQALQEHEIDKPHADHQAAEVSHVEADGTGSVIPSVSMATGDDDEPDTKYLPGSPKYKAFMRGHAQAQTLGEQEDITKEQALRSADARDADAKTMKRGEERAHTEGLASGYRKHAQTARSENEPAPAPVVKPSVSEPKAEEPETPDIGSPTDTTPEPEPAPEPDTTPAGKDGRYTKGTPKYDAFNEGHHLGSAGASGMSREDAEAGANGADIRANGAPTGIERAMHEGRAQGYRDVAPSRPSEPAPEPEPTPTPATDDTPAGRNTTYEPGSQHYRMYNQGHASTSESGREMSDDYLAKRHARSQQDAGDSNNSVGRALNEGRTAGYAAEIERRKTAPSRENPYEPGTVEHATYESGYNAGGRHARAKGYNAEQADKTADRYAGMSQRARSSQKTAFNGGIAKAMEHHRDEKVAEGTAPPAPREPEAPKPRVKNSYSAAEKAGIGSSGKWKKLSDDEIMDRKVPALMEMHRQQAERYQQMGISHPAPSEDDVRERLKAGGLDEIHEHEDGTTVTFQKGVKPKPAKKTEVLDHTERLRTANPAKKFNVTVVKNDQRGVMGHTMAGGTRVYLHSLALTPTGQGAYERSAQSGHFMPIAKTEPSATKYVLTHEYGHDLDTVGGMTRNPETEKLLKPHVDNASWNTDISTYGKTNSKEAYAEAFSEWFLSGGQTENKTVRALAEKEGWPA